MAAPGRAFRGGKSTLLYLLNGLVPHVLEGEIRGEVQVDGLMPRISPFGN